MALTSTSILSVVELVLYATLAPFVLVVSFKHGESGLSGYFYLNVCCVVRLASDIVSLVDNNASIAHPPLAELIISSIGLSPLLLALSGFIHEVHHYIIAGQLLSKDRKKKIDGRLWLVQWQIHTLCILGMVLLVVGNVKLETSSTASQAQTGKDLRSAGVVLILVLWVLLSLYAGFLQFWCRRQRGLLFETLQELDIWIIIAAVFAGCRVLYAMVYVFDPSDPKANPETGSLAVKVVLVVLVEYLAVLALTIGGWRSMHVSEISKAAQMGANNHVRYQRTHSKEHHGVVAVTNVHESK